MANYSRRTMGFTRVGTERDRRDSASELMKLRVLCLRCNEDGMSGSASFQSVRKSSSRQFLSRGPLLIYVIKHPNAA